MDHYEVLRCNGCHTAINLYDNLSLIDTPHSNCSLNGLLTRFVIWAREQDALIMKNLPVSARPRLTTDITPQIPITTGALARNNTRPASKAKEADVDANMAVHKDAEIEKHHSTLQKIV